MMNDHKEMMNDHKEEKGRGHLNVRTRAVVAAVVGAVLIGAIGVPQAQADHGEAAVGRQGQHLTQKDAKFYIERHLKKTAGKYWRYGHKKKVNKCKNLSSVRVRCKVSWYYKEKVYVHGSVTAYYKSNDPYVYFRDNLDVDPI